MGITERDTILLPIKYSRKEEEYRVCKLKNDLEIVMAWKNAFTS